MANSYLIDLGINDSTADIVRKCNQNFRRLAMDQRKQAQQDVRHEATRADSVVAGAVGEINTALANAKKELEEALKKAKEELTTKIIEETTPDVGTWIFCEYDPNTKWPGTKWEKVAEGTYLVSAGSTYKANNKYGANTVTLTVDQIPSHRHQENSSTMQWTADDPNGSTPGNVKGTVVAPGQGHMGAGNFRYTSYTASTGGGQAHNNMPNSIAIPLWHRVS